jgi:hypothetical protein
MKPFELCYAGSQAMALFICAPTVVNMNVATLQAKLKTLQEGLAHWGLAPHSVTNGTLACALMSSQSRLLRLSYYAASLHGADQTELAKKPSSLLVIRAEQFNAEFPSYQRWLRRHGHELSTGVSSDPGSLSLISNDV